jgi:hypothetical protein
MIVDKNGVPVLPDLIGIDWEKTMAEGYAGPPIEIKIELKELEEIDAELFQICVPLVPRPPKRTGG